MAQAKAKKDTGAKSRVSTLEGHEIAEDYVRTHLPKGRWGDTWDLFKSNFVRFVIINVIVLLCFVPGIVVVYFRNVYVKQMGATYPFSSNPLFTYPFTSSMIGSPEGIILSSDLLFYSLLIVAGLIASIGISGACYSIRKLINTHGQFTIKGFFLGIKKCYFSVAFPVTVFMVFMFGSLSISDWANYFTAFPQNAKGGAITAKVFVIIATVVVGVICAWLLAVGVSYKVKPKYLFKNTFVLLFGTFLQTVFMLGFSLLPAWLLLIGTVSKVVRIIGYIIFIFIGFSFIILSWMSYTQWVFDMFITPAIADEEAARKANLTPKQLAAEKEQEEKAVARELLAAGKSELVGRPIRAIEGGTKVEEIGVAYGRGDLQRVADDRGKIKSELDEYYNAHKGDTKYVEYERLFAEREKVLNTEGKKGKKKKVSQNNLLNRK